MESFARSQPRLFADHAFAIHLLGAPVAIGDLPMTRDQARRHRARILDADAVGKA